MIKPNSQKETSQFLWRPLLTFQLYTVVALVAIASSLIVYTIVMVPLLSQQKDMSIVRVLTVTAYSPRRSETDATPFINAAGAKVAEGQIAVSKDLFLAGWVYGRPVWIEGYGVYKIMDRMNYRYTDRIDIFMWSTKKAKKFGLKRRIVALLGEVR